MTCFLSIRTLNQNSVNLHYFKTVVKVYHVPKFRYLYEVRHLGCQTNFESANSDTSSWYYITVVCSHFNHACHLVYDDQICVRTWSRNTRSVRLSTRWRRRSRRSRRRTRAAATQHRPIVMVAGQLTLLISIKMERGVTFRGSSDKRTWLYDKWKKEKCTAQWARQLWRVGGWFGPDMCCK